MGDLDGATTPVSPRRSSRGRATVALVALVTVLSLVAAACGSGRSSSSGDDNGSTATSAATGGDTSFGDLASPCGAGDAQRRHPAGRHRHRHHHRLRRRRRLPAQSPGLNHEMSDAMKAMIDWCNDAGRHQRPRGQGQLLRRQDPRGQQRHDRGLRRRSSCSSVRAGRSTPSQEADPPRLQPPVGARLRGEPGVRQRPADGPAGAEPGRLHAGRRSRRRCQKQFPEEVKKTAVMFANYAATIDTKDKVAGVLPEVRLRRSSTAPRSTTSRASPTGSPSSSS